MDFTDPLCPRSLDDLVDHVESGQYNDGYGQAPTYQPYQWELPWIKTPEPFGPPPEEPWPPPERLPSYNDCLMTTDLFIKLMHDLNE